MTLPKLSKFENINKPRMDFTKFTRITTKARGQRNSFNFPMASMSRTSLSLNAYFTENHPQFSKVIFSFYDNQILISFYRKDAEVVAPLKIIRPAKYKHSYISFSGVATYLASKTDEVNLQAFNYKFKLNMVGPDKGIIDLTQPYSKTKKHMKK